MVSPRFRVQALTALYLSLATVFAGTVLLNGRTPLLAQVTGLPDYAVEGLFVSPTLPEAGEEVSFHGRVTNVGQTRGSHRDFVRLQLDQGNNGTWDYTSTLNIVGALPVGSSNIVQWGTSGATPPITWPRVAGTHAMKVCLHIPSSTDTEAYTSDANASNDCSTLVFQTLPVGGSSSSAVSSRAASSQANSVSAIPDFSMEDLRFYQDATGYAITVVVKNNGASTAKWAHVRLDLDGVRGAMAYGIKPLSQNATDTAVWSSSVLPPKNGWVGTEGYHTAIACIDNENGDPADSNASNNCKQLTFAMKGVANAVAVPDFSLEDLRFYQDTTGYAMTVVVKNNGASTSEWAQVRLDIDGISGVMLYGIKPLSQNASDTATWSSSSLPPKNGWTPTAGTHRATACIDNENDRPADSNAANDCKSITFTYQGASNSNTSTASSVSSRSSTASSQRSSVSSTTASGLPDHVISSMNVAPSGTDGRINAWGVVRNSGNGDSQNYSYAVLEYRHRGETAWTRIMQTRYVSALRPGTEEEMNWPNFADYSGLPYAPGIYEFHVCADVWDSLLEANEGNNCYPPMTVIIPQYGTVSSTASRSSSERSSARSSSSVSSRRSSRSSSSISSARSSSSAVSSAASSASTSTACFSATELHRKANVFCENHCSRYSGKCGVNTFAVGRACSARGMYRSATWTCYDGTSGSPNSAGTASSRSSARSSEQSSASSAVSSRSSARSSSSVSSARSSAQSSSEISSTHSSSSSASSTARARSNYQLGGIEFHPSATFSIDQNLDFGVIVKNLGAAAELDPFVTVDIWRNGSNEHFVSSLQQPLVGLANGARTTVWWRMSDGTLTWVPHAGSTYRLVVNVNMRQQPNDTTRTSSTSTLTVTAPRSSSSSSRSSARSASSTSSSRSSAASASSSSVSTQATNLTIVDFVTSPTTITEGNQWGAMGKVKNIGRVRSQEALVRLQFYEFNDSTRVSTSSLERVIPPLDPNGQFSFSWSTRYPTDDLPENVFPGAHRVTACVNDRHTAPESNYADNCGWMYLLVDPRPASSSSASFRATGVDTPRSSSSASSATSSVSSRSLSSSSRPASSSSSSTSRQSTSQSSSTSAAAGLPDLWLKQFSMPDATHFRYTLANIGTVTVPPYTAEVRFEWIDTAGGAHLLFGSTGNSALDPADTAYPHTLTISPGLIPAQAVRLRATVDQVNRIQESNKGNNMLEADIVR